MSNIKISQLPYSATLSGSEIIPMVQDGDTKSTSINSIVGKATLQSVTDNGNNITTNDIILEYQNGTDYYSNSMQSSGFVLNYNSQTLTASVNGIYIDDNSGNLAQILPDLIGINSAYLTGGALVLASSTPGGLAELHANNVTALRNIQLPDASGTLALLSDIPPAFSFETLYVTGTSPTSATLITKTFTNVIKDTGSYVKLPASPNVGDIYNISNVDTSLNLWVSSGSNNIYNAGTNSGTNLYNCGTTSNRIYVFQYVSANIWITWKLTSN
jgi:hypothetical protein